MLRMLQYLPESIRAGILRRKLRFRENEVATLTAEVASNARDALGSARLVHDAYVRRGLAEVHPSGVRATPWHFLPSSFVVVAKHAGEVIGTQTLQIDSPFGLPMDAAFSAPLAPLRGRGRLLAEVGALAIAPQFCGTGTLHLLNRAMFAIAESIGVDDLVAVVNPAAADVYRTLLCFDRVGEVTRYPGLAQPRGGTALHLPLDEARERFRRNAPESHAIYVERVWNEISVPALLARDVLDEGRLDAVRALVAERRDVVRALSRRQIDELRRAVPELFWPTPSQLDPSEIVSLSAVVAHATA